MAHHETLKLILQSYCRKNGTTMHAIAGRLHITPAALSKKLAGERSITLEEAHEIACILGISLDAYWSLPKLYELVH